MSISKLSVVTSKLSICMPSAIYGLMQTLFTEVHHQKFMTVFKTLKHLFEIPENIIYLDGNSLGLLPKSVGQHVDQVIREEWGQGLITSWNKAGWMEQPARVGNTIANLVGADTDSIVVGDTLTIKVYQALASALIMRPDRRVILSDKDNFPADLYMAQGLIRMLGKDHELRLVDFDSMPSAIDNDTAVVLLTEVSYRTGRMYDMNAITEKAQSNGAVMIWDLAHSAGAIPVNLKDSNCEFAVGCTYKYLNGGPGSPAFIYVRPDLIEQTTPALMGWLGHDAPFSFEQFYRPSGGIERMRVGTPSVIQMSALEEALKIWQGIDLRDIRQASIKLSERFIQQVESRCPSLVLESPRDSAIRGSQVSFSFEHSYGTMQALIANGVIGDFRAPNLLRFGFAPLYLDEQDVDVAVDRLVEVLDKKLWNNPSYAVANRVT
ncbi:MAG: kynureninase [Parasphingorhabdus sp.]|jgi:kynureninase